MDKNVEYNMGTAFMWGILCLVCLSREAVELQLGYNHIPIVTKIYVYIYIYIFFLFLYTHLPRLRPQVSKELPSCAYGLVLLNPSDSPSISRVSAKPPSRPKTK